MTFLERLKKLFNEKESAHDVINELTKSYKKRKEMGLKDPIDTTVDRIMELIYDSKNPNITAEKMLRAALEEEQMPNRVAEKVSVKISQAEDLKDDVISSAFEKSHVDIPDQVIDKVLEEGEFETDMRLRLMKNVTDESIIESRVLQEFDELYDEAKNLNDYKISNRLRTIKNIVDSSDSDMQLVPHIERIIAKKIAENLYDDNLRGTLLFAFSQHIPFVKMFADDLPSQVEKEFELLEHIGGKKPDRFDKSLLRKQILDEIGKSVGTKYKEEKDSGKRFIVPRSKMMESLSEEEIKDFLHTISIYSSKDLSKKDTKSIVEQIRGKITNNTTRASLIVAAMDGIEDKDEGVKKVTELMADPAKLDSIFLMDEVGLLDIFASMSLERRKKAITIIKDTITSRAKQAQENLQNSSQEKPQNPLSTDSQNPEDHDAKGDGR